mmetsp:Transcript_54464/g.122511  ORF Transcript_54464/g.122511 Transcript_54464/m.122511 type:complete len:200 (+) Transcript_54464:148-747(+)
MSALTKLLMSCAWTFRISDSRIRPFTAGRTLANLLISRIRSLMAMAWSVVTRSSLFRIILSANATCWYASLTLPSSTLSSRRAGRFLLSAMATTASSRSSSVSCGFVMNVRTMGTGSAMPVVSMMMPSIRLPLRMSARIWVSPFTRSPRIVQHMQPLPMTMTFSAIASLSCFNSASSMDISPNSFSITAIFLSCCSWRM